MTNEGGSYRGSMLGVLRSVRAGHLQDVPPDGVALLQYHGLVRQAGQGWEVTSTGRTVLAGLERSPRG